MRSKLVVGNWKMNGSRHFLSNMVSSLVAQESEGFGQTDQVVICPPVLYLADAAIALKGASIQYGAQNINENSGGAYTGEVSAEMLKDLGCDWVLIGHSERRALYGESNELVSKKIKKALASGINTILCVGETLQQREAEETKAVISEQISYALKGLDLSEMRSQFVIAYEPVWAIGTGKTATPEQAQEIHEFIRSEMPKELSNTSILYGGSVKASNAAELFSQPDIDGGLIGGASLVAEDFINICQAMQK